MLKRIEFARQRGVFSDLDVHFARSIGEWGSVQGDGVGSSNSIGNSIARSSTSNSSASVLLAAALLSQLTSAGHVCLDLATVAEVPLWSLLGEGRADENDYTPPLADWQAALRAHLTCGDAHAFTPLVLDGTRLYLRRYFNYETAVAHAWHARRQVVSGEVPAQLLAQLFPPPDSGEDKQRDQRAAAVTALQQGLTLISGGPGTGKTTTLASVLGLLLAQQETTQTPPLKILLAAPTGKAAARMQEAIRGAKARLPLPESIIQAMPDAAVTLHRLLGGRPQGGGMAWRHDASNPLDCDVLVIDEASMIDLAMMARVFAALPSAARLILLGDRDQLASVDAGAVFADLCAAGAAQLNVSFRFDRSSGIGQLAQLMRTGDVAGLLQLLNAPPSDVLWQPLAQRSQVVAAAADQYAAFIEQARHVESLANAADLFTAFAAYRLLTPLRKGAFGVLGLNAAIEHALVERGSVPARSHWYVGRPVMVTANDYALRLFNGDIGICVADPAAGGELRVWFPADEGVRSLPPARLPPHETAWAMTVHKSQGSEFDHVALVLPDDQGELLSRELIYTAVTRARQSVVIWAAEEALRTACERRIVRHSGLVSRLVTQ